MLRPLTHAQPRWRRAPRRGGAVLLTCFSLITILMVLGLAFMMYAAKEKAVAQAYAEAASRSTRLTPDPTDTINRFLGALIYDELDDHDPSNGGTALLNAMRGHSIARSMYGSRYDFATNPWPGSTVPWAGVGIFHETNLYGDRALHINHTLMVLPGATPTPYLLDAEWTGSRSIAGGVVPPFASSRTGNYVGKHAGYTYPDLKNLWLGQRDPATGEVLVPSFHRDWLFRHASQTGARAGETALHPNNPNWYNSNKGFGVPEADARFRILRPRYDDHPKFPRVPPNAPDSSGVVTYTGDVQNLPGTVGVQKNDSIWMHVGLPQITLEDGRIVQPMIAPLILPLDGLFDLSMHGNQLAGVAPTVPLTASSHRSHGGYGPYETNLGYGLAPYGTIPYATIPTLTAVETERRQLIQNRTPSRAAAFDSFTAGRPLPSYSSVNWTGQQVTFQLPSGGSLRGLPSSGDVSFTPPYGGFQNDNAAVNPHPAGYSPNEWLDRSNPSANPNSPVYPYSDLKRLSLRYAFTPDWYFQAFATKTAQTTFLGDPATYPFFISPGATTAAQYRNDPAHTRRLLFSTKNNSLDRPAPAPNFSRTVAEALQITAGTTKPGALFAVPTAYPQPGATLGQITDFAASNLWVNAKAALGSVNLNRPLADYRTDTTKPLSAANVGNAAQADADRQALAKDIFARLVVALGAAASVDASGNVTVQVTPTTNPTQYDALRYLAQVAVNLVDYIDNDDVSTVFVWNPDTTTGAADLTNAADVGNRVVFGVEKPRLVLNEVYSEINNDPIDKPTGDPDPTNNNNPKPPTGPAYVRFWAELLNPTSTPHTDPTTGIFGTGAVNLSAYQIQIARANRGGTATAGSLLDVNDPGYQANTAGQFSAAADATFTFPATPNAAPAGQPGAVEPNNAQYAPAGNLPPNGFVLVGPRPAMKANSEEFNPGAAGVWANQVVAPDAGAAPSTGMGYQIPLPNNAGTLNSTDVKRHVVLLRRAANPYLPPAPATNPYVTVDVMDYVPAFDAVHRLSGQGTNRGARPAMGAMGTEYDPVAQRFSVGKVQPLAGRAVATNFAAGAGNYNTYQFTNSMVLAQTAVNAGQPNHTFGRHNGNAAAQPAATTVSNPGTAAATLSETIMLPFDWLPHMDRPLETLGDVFVARDSKPHLLTNEFVKNSAAGLVYNLGYAQWQFHSTGLARGLEYLTVKVPDDRVGHGGRIGGKVNVNALQDRRVAQGLWDPQASNVFDLPFVNNTIWGDSATATTSWMKTRTPLQARLSTDGATQFQVPVPTSSVADQSTGTDRPFLPFGAPVATTGTFAYTTPSAGQDGDTILRRDPTAPGQPLLFQTSALARSHPYLQSEPVRKVMNNVTTVSHTFVVYVTIGYFDVSNPAIAGWPSGVPFPPQFGAEVYDKIPGDMRQKYVAVVDMSNMALKPDPTTAGADPHATGQPFFTSLTATARAGSATISVAYTSYDATTNPANPVLYVAADGQQVPIVGGGPGVGTQLVIGYGSGAQVVTVQTVGPAGQLTLTAALGRDAWGGTCVSNVRPGYAGPQPAFDYNAARYKPVVPYVERLR